MRIIPPHYDKVFIIGNGFDLNLGMKTRYVDFINSIEFSNLEKSENTFAFALKKSLGDARWIDAEVELKHIAQEFAIDITWDSFKELCSSLMQYMSETKMQENFRDTYSYELLSKKMTSDSIIIDFNYTDSIYKLLSEIKHLNIKLENSVIKVHGSVNEKAIIFGIEDEANIPLSHLYLQKSFQKHFKGITLDKLWNGVTEIHIFGHSLGETDHPYFRDLFSKSADGEFAPRHLNLFLYHYGDESYNDLMKQIALMTDNRLMKMKQNINFVPVDVL